MGLTRLRAFEDMTWQARKAQAKLAADELLTTLQAPPMVVSRMRTLFSDLDPVNGAHIGSVPAVLFGHLRPIINSPKKISAKQQAIIMEIVDMKRTGCGNVDDPEDDQLEMSSTQGGDTEAETGGLDGDDDDDEEDEDEDDEHEDKDDGGEGDLAYNEDENEDEQNQEQDKKEMDPNLNAGANVEHSERYLQTPPRARYLPPRYQYLPPPEADLPTSKLEDDVPMSVLKNTDIRESSPTETMKNKWRKAGREKVQDTNLKWVRATNFSCNPSIDKTEEIIPLDMVSRMKETTSMTAMEGLSDQRDLGGMMGEAAAGIIKYL
jgi:hypothetical protein